MLVAYVSSSLVLTLTVPYDHIDSGSALVQMWTYVGARKCQALVAIGATAGLSVAMFGSMFPMPRVIYAMAQDGLIFRQLAQLWDRTNAPGIATLLSGLAAALVAMVIRLEVLVEMMSIGTLLAYTLVSTCVLVLRYQPHSTSLVELLPAQLRTPQPPSTPDPMHVTTGECFVQSFIEAARSAVRYGMGFALVLIGILQRLLRRRMSRYAKSPEAHRIRTIRSMPIVRRAIWADEMTSSWCQTDRRINFMVSTYFDIPSAI